MGKLLYEVKGGGQGQAMSKSEITAAADAILQPLMDLLDGKKNEIMIIEGEIGIDPPFLRFPLPVIILD